MTINENYRRAVQERRQIVENYNMGFLMPSEYYCQLWDVYSWLNGDDAKKYERTRKIWHLLCLLPKWVFSLYERVR